MFSHAKVLVTLLVVVVVTAEPPVRQNDKFSKQFQASEPRAFQPFLLRPLGGQFVILEQLQSAAQPVNNPPQAQGNVPEDDVRGDGRNVTEVANRNSTEPAPEDARNEKLTNAEEQGIYYIYHPNGLLQKVVYSTNDDVEKMAFSAKLKYENVEPIREPIYTYDPETYVFKRI